MKASKTAKAQPVLITTEFRGIFFGYIKDDKQLPQQITLTEARNCISWSSDCGGFLGLAAKGPSTQCKIGTEVDVITLYKITSVTPVTVEASEKWKKA